MLSVKLLLRLKQVAYIAMVCMLFGCNRHDEKHTKAFADSTIYYCPMHPEIIQDHPGKCPRPSCAGMELVRKDPDQFLASALRPVSSNMLSKTGLVNPQRKKLPVMVEALGYIDYDNNEKFDVSSRYSGRIQKLYVKFNYQPIKKGDMLFEIYSADLVTAQENFLYLLKNSPHEKELIEAAKKKLQLLQLTPEQLQEIETTKKITYSLPVYSKYEGHIHEMLDSKMGTDKMNSFQSSPLLSVREGMYVERGKILFNVVNPHRVVVMLKIKTADVGKVHLDQAVSFFVNNDPGMKMSGKIDLIEPIFTDGARSLMVRVNMDNMEHKHKIGTLVSAAITADSLDALWIPATAIVDLGKSKIAWVEKKGSFQAVKIETGICELGMVQITDGLFETDKIALEAHFLSDSEGFIKVKDDE